MKVDITIRQLQAFIAVLERGSFSEAAQSMHLSQAALSGLVKELESRLGVRLFNRSTRRVEVSEVGASFEPQVRRALAALEEAVESVVNLRELHRGGGSRRSTRDVVVHPAATPDQQLLRTLP